MAARFLVALTALAVFFGLASSAQGQQPSRFGEMVPGLAPLNSQTNQQLADLAQTQLDPNADSENNCALPDTASQSLPGADCTGSGFTYFGQFVDHDLTLDTSPSPLAPVDFTQLINNRTFRFDLDQVYGGGPTDPASAKLYAPDGKHFLLQDPNPNGVPDLPRNPDGSAILVEARQDENQILAQLQLAFLKAHNVLIDQGLSFNRARRLLTLYYQRAVLDDFLPHTVGNVRLNLQSLMHIARLVRTGITPIEFSVAAYRFGHSQVRRAYEVNDTTGKLQVFSLTAPLDSLMGGRQIQAGRQIEWGNFFPDLEANGDVAGANHGRKIDQLISSSLFALPIPGAEAAGSNVLAFRNMIRAKFYNMPSGQTFARQAGVTPLNATQLAVPASVAPAFANGVPLWYYVLREASVQANGRTLGTVGGRIVKETFIAELLRDPNSILRRNIGFRPNRKVAGDDRKMQVSDILRLAGVVEEADDEGAADPAVTAAAVADAAAVPADVPEDLPGTSPVVPPAVP